MIRRMKDVLSLEVAETSWFLTVAGERVHGTTLTITVNGQTLTSPPAWEVKKVGEHEYVLKGLLAENLLLEQILKLEHDQLTRQLFLTQLSGEVARIQNTSLLLELPSIEDANVSVPMARLFPETPMRELLERPVRFDKFISEETKHRYMQYEDEHGNLQADLAVTAPESGAASVRVVWENCRLEIFPVLAFAPTRAYVYGRDGKFVIEHNFTNDLYARAGERLELARQVVTLNAPATIVGAFWAENGCAVPEPRAAWAKDAVVYEVDLEFHGGLKKLQEQLPGLKSLGFNTLYLMPWHLGGYATLDYEVVNPAYGTEEDLKALTTAAHTVGFRVLFDLLVNIAQPESRYVRDQPDWFYLDENGKPLKHPAWGNCCFDVASPGLRAYLKRYAVRCCGEWGADGFRVDAVAYRGGNWQSPLGLQPSEHGNAIFSLMGEIREAIRTVDDKNILMAEVFGPAQVPVSDLVCYAWVNWLDWLLEGVNTGRMTGAMLGRALRDYAASLPQETWLTTYTHTHDSKAFVGRELDGPSVHAVFEVLTFLSAGVMVFGGGWGMRARPTEGAESEAYQRLFAVKEKLGGVATSEVVFLEHPGLLLARRPSKLGEVLVVANLSNQAQLLELEGQTLYGPGSEKLEPLSVVVKKA
jgi:hypothetical protein